MSSTTGGPVMRRILMKNNNLSVDYNLIQHLLFWTVGFVGLVLVFWAFSTIRHPLEMLRLTGSSEVSGQKDPGNYSLLGNTSGVDGLSEEAHVGCNGIMSTVASLKEKPLSLNLSIAGGPPPAKQNYRATVSLPVMSRHLRSDLSSKSDVRYHASCDLDNTNSIQEKNYTDNTPCVQIAQTEVVSIKCKRTEFGSDVQSRLNSEFDEVDSLRNENNSDSQERDCPGIGSNASGPVGSGEIGKRKQLMITMDQQDKDSDIGSLVCEAGSNVTSVDANADSAGKKDLKIVDEGANVQKSPEVQITKPAAHRLGKEVEEVQLDRAVEFDPIKQHRHFCPWIISTGNVVPGWQQTLKALDHEKDHSHLTITNSPPSTPMLERDDPITSIRKLFMSPSSTKRKKVT